MPEPSAPFVQCSMEPCTYDALGVITTVTLDDLPEAEFLAVTLSPRPILDDDTAADDDSTYLCRHHIVAQVEGHLLHASRQSPMRLGA